jgi:hypothetical protein
VKKFKRGEGKAPPLDMVRFVNFPVLEFFHSFRGMKGDFTFFKNLNCYPKSKGKEKKTMAGRNPNCPWWKDISPEEFAE